jgi:hypothetical protein
VIRRNVTKAIADSRSAPAARLAAGRPRAHIGRGAGAPKNGVQFMVKDSKKYVATGGWGYGEFHDGKPAEVAVVQKCFPCHEAAKDRDFVFTRYSP